MLLRSRLAPQLLRQPRILAKKLSSATAEILHPQSDFATLNEMVSKSVERFAERNLFGTRVGEGFEWITYRQFGREVEKFRNVLHTHKFGFNDKLGLISNNRVGRPTHSHYAFLIEFILVEWAVAACAAQSLGGQIVPMYEVQMEKDWRYILEDSGASILLVSTEKIFEKTSPYIGSVGNIRAVICMDASEDLLISYKRWMKSVENERPVPSLPVSPNDLCAIIYTSGTTGKPKGVDLSHANIMSNVNGVLKLFDTVESHTSLAFLPWAHVYGMSGELYMGICRGNSMGVVASREQIVEGISLVKPSLLICVPTLLNRIFDGVMKRVDEGPPLAKRLFYWALRVARKRNHLLEHGRAVPVLLSLQHRIFDKIVFSKVRARLGENLSYVSNGGAAVPLKVAQFFEDIGIPVLNGYGLTETSPIIAFSGPEWSMRRLGTCGVTLPGVSILIVDPSTLEEMPAETDGEICVSGPNVMQGYHNRPDASAEVFLMRGGRKYFRTGDLGHMVDGKFLKVTGRIKEQFKLENGKYVVPTPVEEAICRSSFIAQVSLVNFRLY